MPQTSKDSKTGFSFHTNSHPLVVPSQDAELRRILRPGLGVEGNYAGAAAVTVGGTTPATLQGFWNLRMHNSIVRAAVFAVHTPVPQEKCIPTFSGFDL